MSPVEQRIAIAGALGWATDKSVRLAKPLDDKQRQYWLDCGAFVNPSASLTHLPTGLPDFPTDLNACHEMEKALTFKEGVKFRLLLARNSDGPRATAETVEAALCHATAAQRCEAFLKVKGLWKDTP